MGWFINLVPLHVDIEPDDTFGSLVRRVRQEFRDTKEAGDVPTLRVAEILAQYMDFDAESSDRPPIMSYLDGAIIPGHDKWLEHNFWGLTGSGDDDDVYVWMMRMPGSTYVTCSCPDTPQAVHAVTSYFAGRRDPAGGGSHRRRCRHGSRRRPPASGRLRSSDGVQRFLPL